MKVIIVFLTIALLLCVFSCGKKSTEPNETPNLELYGTWTGVYDSQNGPQNITIILTNATALWQVGSDTLFADIRIYDNNENYMVVLWTNHPEFQAKYQKFTWTENQFSSVTIQPYIELDSQAEASGTNDNGGYNPIVLSQANVPLCVTPIFSPAGGTFDSSQTISISCTTGGVSIYYTIDGNDPTPQSTLYSNPITISSTTTLKAKAFKKNWQPSNTATAVYSFPFTITEVSFLPAQYADEVCKIGGLLYIVDTFNGFKIANVADPANPYETCSVSLNGDVYGIAVTGDYAYVPVDGLQVFDCSDPTNPSQINTYSNNNFACHATISNNKLYLALNYYGIMVFDISDPYSTLYPDHLLGSFAVPGYVLSVKVSGNYAYVTEDTAEKGLRIYDISDLANPLPLGYFATTGSATYVKILGDYAYLCDYDNGVYIINISNPNNPYQVGHYVNAGKTRGLDVIGNLMYIAAGSAGLRVVDISVPSNPTEITHIDTSDLALDVQVYGSYAYVSARNAGVRIFQVSGKK